MALCRRVFLASFTTLTIALSFAGAGWSQEAKTTSIVLVNYWQVIRESKAGGSLRQQIDAQREKFQSEIQAGQATLEKARTELAQQQGVLAPNAFAKKRQEYQNQAEQLQQKVQSRKRALDQMRQQGTGQIEKVLREILAGIVKERGYDLVLHHDPKAGAVIMFNKALDITPEVIQKLDAQLPGIKVNPAE